MNAQEKEQAHRDLVAARNALERDGWCQGGGGMEPGGSACAVGAIARNVNVNTYPIDNRHVYNYFAVYRTGALKALGEAIGVDPGNEVFLWNDKPERTKAEVLAAFDRAIASTAPPPPNPHWTDLIEDVERLETSRAVIA